MFFAGNTRAKKAQSSTFNAYGITIPAHGIPRPMLWRLEVSRISDLRDCIFGIAGFIDGLVNKTKA